MKTSELTGAALDWAVAKCEGHEPHHYAGVIRTTMRGVFGPECRYSTDWAQGGWIIERDCISINHLSGGGDAGVDVWVATRIEGASVSEGRGETPLIAAMRSHVAALLGDEVDVPDDLLEVA